MREIEIGDRKIGLKATPLALFYYKQQFGRDLVGDIIRISGIDEHPEEFDALLFLQMAWAMNKAYEGVGRQFPSFESWLAQFDSFDIGDGKVIQDIADEAHDGFFRTSSPDTGKQRGSKR